MGCQNEPKLEKLLNLFPTKKTGCIKQKKVIAASEKIRSSEILKQLTESPSQKKELKEVTKNILTEANNKIKKTFPGLDIADAAQAVPEFHLEKKKSKAEKQRIKRKICKDFKENIESQRMETAVYRTYGTDVSLQKRQKIRLSESFETYAECKNRSLKANKNARNHIGSVSWDSNGCLNEFKSYAPDISNINFSALARKYGMKNNAGNFPGNWGQVVKEFLKEKNVDFSRLHYKSKEHSDDRVRRCKRKVQGSGISMPCDPTNQAVKKELKRLVSEGKYTLGELIVPQLFEKMF